MLQSGTISLVATLWLMFNIVVVSFPSSTQPTANTMNYTAAVSGAWILLCLAYYFCPVYGGRYWFKGPIANIDAAEKSEVESEVSDEKGVVA